MRWGSSLVGRPKPTCRGGSSHLWVIGADRASRTTPPTSHPPTEVSNSKPLLLSMIKPLVTQLAPLVAKPTCYMSILKLHLSLLPDGSRRVAMRGCSRLHSTTLGLVPDWEKRSEQPEQPDKDGDTECDSRDITPERAPPTEKQKCRDK